MKIYGKHYFIHSVVLLLIAVTIVQAGCQCDYEVLEVDGIKRHYLLHLPDNLPLDKPVPLILVLHQFMDTPAGMRAMTGFDDVADREGFIVVYPRGRWRRWDAGSGPTGADHRFLSSLIAHLEGKYNIDSGLIYATGASAGAIMIQAFARHSERFAAIAPVMGTLSEEDIQGKAAPLPLLVLLIHGIEDKVIPYGGGQSGGPHPTEYLSAEATAAYWAAVAGCSAPPQVEVLPVANVDAVFVRSFKYQCAGTLEVTLLAVGGCGHSWPGHQSRFPRFIVGPSVDKPEATLLIWEFFQRQVRQNVLVTDKPCAST